MREVVKSVGFILLIIGTLGLLITEFILDGGRAVTMTLAAVNVVGLATLAFAHWGMRKINKP